MTRTARGALALPVALYVLTGLSVALGALRVAEVPLGVPNVDSPHLEATPLAMWIHALSGTLFGLIGPWQFSRVMRRRFGRAHRVAGRIYAVAGLGMAASGLSLLLSHPDSAEALVDAGRAVFSVGLVAALALAVQAIRLGDRERHRDWMIRAYAYGMGTAPVGIIFVPIFVATGEPPTGPGADLIFIGSWVACALLAEALIHRLHRPMGVPA